MDIRVGGHSLFTNQELEIITFKVDISKASVFIQDLFYVVQFRLTSSYRKGDFRVSLVQLSLDFGL